MDNIRLSSLGLYIFNRYIQFKTLYQINNNISRIKFLAIKFTFLSCIPPFFQIHTRDRVATLRFIPEKKNVNLYFLITKYRVFVTHGTNFKGK